MKRSRKRNETIFKALNRNTDLWFVVPKCEVEHIKVRSRRYGYDKRTKAVTIAENEPFVLGLDGKIETKGIIVALGVGSRSSNAHDLQHQCRLSAHEMSRVSPPCNTDRDASCARKAFKALGVENTLPDDVLWKDLPTLFRRVIQLEKPSKWDMPAVYQNGKFSGNHIGPFIENVNGHDRYVLQVYLHDTNTSLHCIAIVDGRMFDPANGMWLPLSIDSFRKLCIGRIENCSKIK